MQAIAFRPAREADKQRLPRVQHDEQPLSADEPSMLGLPLRASPPKSGLAAFRQCRWSLAVASNGGRELNPVIEKRWFFELITKLFTGSANYQFD
jgi:hypothetical protein